MTRVAGEERICVLPDEGQQGWRVSICRGEGQNTVLGRFGVREEAAAFALAERDRRRERDNVELVIHWPDDCPCCFEG